MGRVLIGLGLVWSLLMGVVEAQGLPSACRSFQLLPFADVLTLEIRQPLPFVEHYIIYALWQGGAEYELRGGATATGPFPETLGATMVFAHADDTFFDANHLCNMRVHSAPTGPDGLMEWAFDCLGPNPPFIRNGQLLEIDCVGDLRQALRRASPHELAGQR